MMTKREEIDQLRHDYFILSQRVELLEKRVAELLTVDAKRTDFQPLNGKTMADIQSDWHARHSSVLHGHEAPKINDLSKGHWIPTPGEVAPKPYAHPCCED